MVKRGQLAVPVGRPTPGSRGTLRIAAVQMDFNPAYRAVVDHLIEPWPPGVSEAVAVSSLGLRDRSLNSLLVDLRAELRATYIATITAKITAILDHLRDSEVDLVCFPEYAVPAEALKAALPYAHSMGLVLPSHSVTRRTVDLLDADLGLESQLVVGQAAYLVALADGSGSTFIQAKVTRSLFEPTLRPAHEFKLIPFGDLTIGVYMCSDFLQGRELAVPPRGTSNPALLSLEEPDLRIVCSYTPSAGPFFEAATQDLLRTYSLARKPSLFVNHTMEGGTSLFALMSNEQEVEARDAVASYRLPPHVEAVVVYDVVTGPQIQARPSGLTPDQASRIHALHLLRDDALDFVERAGGELGDAAQKRRIATDAVRDYLDQRMSLVKEVREHGFEERFADCHLSREASVMAWRMESARHLTGALRDIQPTANSVDRQAIEVRRLFLEDLATFELGERDTPIETVPQGPEAADQAEPSPDPAVFAEEVKGRRHLSTVLKLASFASTAHPEVTVAPWRSLLAMLRPHHALSLDVYYEIFPARNLGISTRITEYTIEMFVRVRHELDTGFDDSVTRLLLDAAALLRTAFGHYYRFVPVHESLWKRYRAATALPATHLALHMLGQTADGEPLHQEFRNPAQVSRALRFLFSRAEPARLRLSVQGGDPARIATGPRPPDALYAPVLHEARTEGGSVVELLDDMRLMELFRSGEPSTDLESAAWTIELAVDLEATPSPLVPEFVFRALCGENFESVDASMIDTVANADLRRAATLRECLALLQFPTGTLPTFGDRSSLGVYQVPFEVLEVGDGVVVGTGFHPDSAEALPIRLSNADRRKHLYVVGKTGTGKTTALLNMALQDIENGHGLCVIDPHGDLYDDLLNRFPEKRADDLVLFDPTDTENPPGLNLLEYDRNDVTQRDYVLDEAVSIFLRLYGHEIFGPRIQNYFRNGALALMSDPVRERTLVDIGRLFLDDAFFKYIIEASSSMDPSVADFAKELRATSITEKGTILPYFQSKFTPFVSNARVRTILGQPRSTVDFRDAMDKGRVVLVNLSKGRIGELTSRLLGMILISKISWASLARAHLSPAERRPFFLFVDEFQNFTTDAFLTILSEARKYGLCLTLAHQYLEQLRISDNYTQASVGSLDAAVFGNVANTVAFQVSARDAARLTLEISGKASEHDLLGTVLAAQPKFHAVAKFDCGGETTSPFSLQTVETTIQADPERGARLREYVANRHLYPRSFVEDELRSARDDYGPPEIDWRKARAQATTASEPLSDSAPPTIPLDRPYRQSVREMAEAVVYAEGVPKGAPVTAQSLRTALEGAGLPSEVVHTLESTFGTLGALRASSDETIRAVPGMGPKRIARLREALSADRPLEPT